MNHKIQTLENQVTSLQKQVLANQNSTITPPTTSLPKSPSSTWSQTSFHDGKTTHLFPILASTNCSSTNHPTKSNYWENCQTWNNSWTRMQSSKSQLRKLQVHQLHEKVTEPPTRIARNSYKELRTEWSQEWTKTQMYKNCWDVHCHVQSHANKTKQNSLDVNKQNFHSNHKQGCYTSPNHSQVLSPEASPIALQSSTEQSHDMDLSDDTLLEPPPPKLPPLDTPGGWHMHLANASTLSKNNIDQLQGQGTKEILIIMVYKWCTRPTNLMGNLAFSQQQILCSEINWPSINPQLIYFKTCVKSSRTVNTRILTAHPYFPWRLEWDMCWYLVLQSSRHWIQKLLEMEQLD